MEIINTLKETAIFADVSEADMQRIASICYMVEFIAGDVIFEQGADSDELYVIAKGEVDIVIDRALMSGEPADRKEIITTLRRGQSFGEVALVDQGMRSAAAYCGQTDTRLVVIPRHKLITLCQEHPAMGYLVMRNLAAELARLIRDRTTDLQLRDWLIGTQGQR